MPDTPTLELKLPTSLAAIFFPLLQQGVEVEVETGWTVRRMLAEQFGIPIDYQKSRITTIFLNHKAVDDPATALVTDGATLALSGAMPGLVGATMRSGGQLAGMRGSITYHNPEQVPEERRGSIRLKLFNLLLQELGPRLLQRGILLAAASCVELLTAQPEGFRPLETSYNGQATSVAQLLTELRANEADSPVALRVRLGEASP